MASLKKQGLIKRYGLDAAELSEIQDLALLCNQHEGLDLKLNWGILRSRPTDQCSDFLYYIDGQLVGYLALFSFSSQEGEISGMVHPDHRQHRIFGTLLDEALQESKSRNLPSLLVIVEQASSSGQAFVRHLPTTYDHSEYKMILEEPRLPSTVNEQLQIRAARLEDTSHLSSITAQAFHIPQEDVNWYNEKTLAQTDRRYYVGEVNQTIIGKIDVNLSAGTALILGVAVLPEHQGKGYGRQILAYTVQELLGNGTDSIWLEVSVENRQALSLYQSCGFKELGSYDYYRLPLKNS